MKAEGRPTPILTLVHAWLMTKAICQRKLSGDIRYQKLRLAGRRVFRKLLQEWVASQS